MKILFFDMEFADGRVPGSIYSIGYTVTDEAFRPLIPPTDLLINPDSTWNRYVENHILAYPRWKVDASPKFPERYEELKALFEGVDLAVGFSLKNDNTALLRDCQRYGLPMLRYRYLDVEKLCARMDRHQDAHGLAGYVTAWCGVIPENQHRSDGDAYATMLLFEALCRALHTDPAMMQSAYPECGGISTEKPMRNQKSKNKSPRHRHGKRETAQRSDGSVQEPNASNGGNKTKQADKTSAPNTTKSNTAKPNTAKPNSAKPNGGGQNRMRANEERPFRAGGFGQNRHPAQEMPQAPVPASSSSSEKPKRRFFHFISERIARNKAKRADGKKNRTE